MPNVSRWLDSLGLAEYAEVFAENGVELRALPALTESDLRELGVKLGHRRILQQAIASLDDETAARRADDRTGDESRAPPEAERRQLTILFCDLVGSTALSRELDPEDLRDLMLGYQAVCRSAIERFGGHIARFLGDGVLAYFGYPNAHEDDAERAIRAALSLVESMPTAERPASAPDSMRVRIGIATGPVVVGDIIGEGAAREHAVIGETPNVAARLQSLAPPNGILVGPLTRTLAGGMFELESLGPQPIKGLPEPVAVCRVLGERASRSRFEAARKHALVPLVGRDEELELLDRRWRRARGGVGQLVLLQGEAGIGKSRITTALRERARSESHVWLLYQCSLHHVDSALYPVVSQLEHAGGIVATDEGVERMRKLTQVLAAHEPVEAGDSALLAALIGVDGAPLPPPARDARQRRAMTLDAVVRQLQAFACTRPVLCIFEDLHWADATTLELIERMIDRLNQLPALLVLTFRPEFEHGWTGLAHSLSLALPRVTRSDAARIAAHVAGETTIDPAVLETLVSRSDGVPLYVEEMTRALVDSGDLAPAAGRPEVSNDTPAVVPETLRDSLMARLDRLGFGKTIAQIGAVLGREFSHDVLAKLSGAPATQIDAGLAELESAGIARPRTGAAGIWKFKHALVQGIAYESLLRRRRQELHAQAAEAIRALNPGLERVRPELIAYHFAAAENAKQALRWWDVAARKAVERGALEEAIGHLRHALAAMDGVGDGAERATTECDVRLRLAESMRVLERSDDAFAALADTESIATRHQLAPVLARVHSMRGNLYFPLGDTAACEREHMQALEWARRAGDRESEASALGGLGDAFYVRGRFISAGEHFERCVHLAKSGGFSALESAYLPMLSVVRHLDLRMPESLELAREGVEICRARGALRPQMIAHACAGFCLYESGDLAHAKSSLDATLALARALGARRFEPVGLGHLAKVYHASGDRARAIVAANEAIAIAQETAVTFVGPRCYSVLATVTDDEAERERALAEGEAVLAAGCVAHNHLHYYRDAIEIRLRQRRFEEVERHADLLAAKFAEEPVGWSGFYVAFARVLAAHGRGVDGPDNMAEIARLHDVAAERKLHQSRSFLEAALR